MLAQNVYETILFMYSVGGVLKLDTAGMGSV